MESHQIQNLFQQVITVTSKYKKIIELTGENFNVFRILKLETSEVRMHSAFIAELLNPKGSHGQKDIFLKLFVKSFCFKGNLIETEFCNVKVEEPIGKINEDKTQGGRIDIIITDTRNNHQIIIENKINASDQNYQLIRYNNHSKNADLIYLTLFGKTPDKKSKGLLEDGIHFKAYSYKYDLLNWLESCRKEAVTYPIIREGLTHYINLIKYLTNQTPNRNMQVEIRDLIKSNLEASFAIYNNLDFACNKISDDFGKDIENEFEIMNLKCKYGISLEERLTGIWIWKPEWKYLNIGFQFQGYDKDLRYGFVAKKNPSNVQIPFEIRNSINILPQNTSKTNLWWPWYRQMEPPYDNWGEFQAWNAIIDGSMKEGIISKTKHLLEISKGLKF